MLSGRNQINSITVRANGRAVAAVKFTGSPGTINDVNLTDSVGLNSAGGITVTNALGGTCTVNMMAALASNHP